MLPYHLFCLHLVVLEYVAMYILLIVDYIIIPFQSYQLLTSIDTPNGLNMHLMDQLCSISNLKDSKWPHKMVTITGETRLVVLTR